MALASKQQPADDWVTPPDGYDGPDDWASPAAAAPKSSTAGAFARGIERGALPAAGGVAGAGFGAAAVAPVAGAAALVPIAGPFLAAGTELAGGAIGAYGGATAVAKAQQWMLDHAPEGVVKALGLDKEQEAADVEEHPIASFTGELAPNLAAFRPGAIASSVEEGAPKLAKLMTHPVTARAVPATIMGAQEAAMEQVNEGQIDPTKVAIAAGVGALSNRETPLGRKLNRAGAAPVDAVGRSVRNRLSPTASPEEAAAPVLEAESVDEAIAAASGVVNRDPMDVDAMAATAKQQGDEALQAPELPPAAPAQAEIVPQSAFGPDWETLYDEAGAEIGHYNGKTQEMRLTEVPAEQPVQAAAEFGRSAAQEVAAVPLATEQAPVPAVEIPSLVDTTVQAGRLRGVQRQVTTGPVDAATFLAMKGGIRNDEGHDLTKGRGLQQFVPGVGPLIRPQGMTIDYAGEALHEAGYFGPPDSVSRPTENEVLQFLEKTRRGDDRRPTKLYKPDEQAMLAQEKAGRHAEDDNARLLQDLHDQAKAMGETLSDDQAHSLAEDMAARGIDPESALVEHIERQAMKEVYSDHEQTGDTSYADAIPQPRAEGEPDFGAGEGVEGPEAVPGDEGGEGPSGAAAAPHPEQAHELATERGADGLPQTLIAGAERSARQLAQAREDRDHGRIRPQRAQQDAGGMFAPKLEQTRDIFDTAVVKPEPVAEVAPAPAPAAESAPAVASAQDYATARQRFVKGELTAAHAHQAFESVLANKAQIHADLMKMTKPELEKLTGPRYRNDKKEIMVRAAYDGMLNGFNAEGAYSYSMGEGPEVGIRKAMSRQTDEIISKMVEARKARAAEVVQTYTDPQTLSQFRDFVRLRGRDKLTDAQRARYDALVADDTRGQAERDKAQKQTVKAVDLGAVTAKVIETKHTQKGHDLFVVQLSERVERDTYNRLNEAAHKLGGRYSSYTKEGAVPGFQFRSREAADKFVALKEGDVSKADITSKREAEVKENAVERLRGMADRMTAESDESLSADRKVNTARRANQAAGAEAVAQANKAMATTMRNLADAIEGGDVRYLDAIRTRADVETLSTLARRAQIEWARAEQKIDPNLRFEKLTEGPITAEMIDKAPYPWPSAHRETALDLARLVENKPGFKRDAIALRKLAEDALRRGDWLVRAENLQTQGILHSIAQEVSKGQFSYRAHDVLDSFKDYGRLQRMGMSNPPTMRAALREFLQYRGSAAKADPIKAAERALIGNKIAGYFPTPPRVIDRMLEAADIRDGMTVLEPSAGKGNILDRLPDVAKNLDIAAIEPHSSLRNVLQMKGANIVDHDFLTHESKYDRIVMNPPFENGQDIDHVRHAFDLLTPEGKVTAIMSEGPFYREDAKAREFRDWLEEVGGTSEKLPQGSFLDSERSTGVATRLVTIDKGAAGDDVRFSRPEGSEGAPGTSVKGVFTPEFDAMRETVGAELRDRLDKMGLKDIALKLPDAIIVTTPDGGTIATSGVYAKKIIAVALEASPDGATHTGVLDHEAVHAARALGLFNKSEWSILSNRAVRDWRGKYKVDERYSDLPEEKRNEEAIAEAYRHWAADRGTQKGTLASIFDKLRNTLSAIGSVFRGHGFKSPDSIFRKFSEGEIGGRPRAEKPDGKPQFQLREKGEGDAVPMRAVFVKSTGKVEFRPVEQPKPKAEPKAAAPAAPKGTSLRTIEGTGEERQRALNSALYNVGEEAPQLKAAERLVEGNFPEAVAIAMRRKNPPAGLHPEFVYMAVEAKAVRDGDVDLQRRLSTSKIAEEATTMGQRIAALRNRAEISPVDDMRRIQEARKDKLKERGADPIKAVETIVEQGRQNIQREAKSTKRPSWNDFVMSLVCKT